jgi:hypothetical protein
MSAPIPPAPDGETSGGIEVTIGGLPSDPRPQHGNQHAHQHGYGHGRQHQHQHGLGPSGPPLLNGRHDGPRHSRSREEEHRPPSQTIRIGLPVTAAVLVIVVAILFAGTPERPGSPVAGAGGVTQAPAAQPGEAVPLGPREEQSPGQNETPAPRYRGVDGQQYTGALAPGRYQIRPATDPRLPYCLGIAHSRQLTPILARSRCSASAQHEFKLELVGNGVYRIAPNDVDQQGTCVAVGGVENGSRLYLGSCVAGVAAQQFTIQSIGQLNQRELYHVQPVHTRSQKMCLDMRVPQEQSGTAPQAVQQKCDADARAQQMAFAAAS